MTFKVPGRRQSRRQLTSGEVTDDEPEELDIEDDTDPLLARVMGGLRLSGL